MTDLPESAFAHLQPVVVHARRYDTLQGAARRRALRALPSTSSFAATEDLLLFVLSYLKTYPLQAAPAARFGLTQPHANSWLRASGPTGRDADMP